MDSAITAIVEVQKDCDTIARYILHKDAGLNDDIVESLSFRVTRTVSPRCRKRKADPFIHFRSCERGLIYVEIKAFPDMHAIVGEIEAPGAKGLFAHLKNKGLTRRISLVGRAAGDLAKPVGTRVPVQGSQVPEPVAPDFAPELLTALGELADQDGAISREGIGRRLAEKIGIDSKEAGPIIMQLKRHGVLTTAGPGVYIFVHPGSDDVVEDSAGDEETEESKAPGQTVVALEAQREKCHAFFQEETHISCALRLIKDRAGITIAEFCDLLDQEFRLGIVQRILVLRPIIIGWQEKQGYIAFTGIKVSVAPPGVVLIGQYPKVSLEDCIAAFHQDEKGSEGEATPPDANHETEEVDHTENAVPTPPQDFLDEIPPDPDAAKQAAEKSESALFDPSQLAEVVRLAQEHREAGEQLEGVQGELQTAHDMLRECINELRRLRKEKRKLKAILSSADHRSAVSFMEAAKAF